MQYDNKDLPYLPDLERGVNEFVQVISEWDVSVFSYNRKKDFEYKGVHFFITDNLITLQSKIEMFGSLDPIYRQPYSDPYKENIARMFENRTRQYTRNYFGTFDFTKKGSLVGYTISTESFTSIHSVILGEKKMLVNNEDWLDRENFHEYAFQHSVANPKEPFDVFFISNVLRMLGE